MKSVPVILIGLLLATRIATGQKLEDVGDLKIEAERGDAQAQIKLANAYLSNSRPKDARRWYESAAQQNSAEGQFQLGNLMLTGRNSTLPDQSLMADPAAGLGLVYSAATNGHKGAWKSLARCLQTGSNCATNLPEAYAWLNLLADAGDTASRNEMNRLALDLSSENIQAGKSVFAAMKQGQWPTPPFAENSRIGGWLRIQGVAISPKEKLVIIGNRTLAEGEQTYLSVDGQFIRLTCLSIDSNSVQVQVEGEAKPRLLRNSFGDSN